MAIVVALVAMAALLPAPVRGQEEGNPLLHRVPWRMIHHDARHTGVSPFVGAQSDTLEGRTITGRGYDQDGGVRGGTTAAGLS